MVLWLVAEGVDKAVMVRYTGHQDATIARWLERMGQHSEGLHNALSAARCLNWYSWTNCMPKCVTANKRDGYGWRSIRSLR